MVPTDFSEYPLFWTEDEMKWLEGSPLERDVENTASRLESDYNLIVQHIPSFGSKYTLAEYKEMHLNNESR